MSVKTLHPLYSAYAPIWKLTRDAVAGDVAIKNGGVTYLNVDFYQENDTITERYKIYKARAYFMGVTGQTRKSTLGMIFRKPAVQEMPPQLEELLDNIDGSGQTLEQVSKYAAGEIENTGRFGFLADYSTSEGGMTKASERAAGLRPYMLTYTAESIINWKTSIIGGRTVLSLVVLREEKDISQNEFTHDYEYKYRALRLIDGVFSQQIYDNGGNPSGEPVEPKMAGKTLSHIPFYFSGSENNLSSPDMPLLYNIAVVNIAHYANSADLEESSHMLSQPHVHLNIGEKADPADFHTLNPGGLKYGSRSGTITCGGSMDVVQAEANNLALVLKKDKEDQMGALGASKLQKTGVPETLGAAKLNASAQTSELDTLVDNLSSAITKCLVDMAGFMGLSDNVSYELNRDFFEGSLTPELITAVTGLQLNGTLAKSDVLNAIRTGSLVLSEDRTNEMIAEDVASELLDNPTMRDTM
jgi:hypothetical protein